MRLELAMCSFIRPTLEMWKQRLKRLKDQKERIKNVNLQFTGATNEEKEWERGHLNRMSDITILISRSPNYSKVRLNKEFSPKSI